MRTHSYAVQSKEPLCASTIVTGRHDEAVWGVRWRPADATYALSFASVSADGYVCLWVLSKGELTFQARMSEGRTQGWRLLNNPFKTDHVYGVQMDETTPNVCLIGACVSAIF